MEKQQFIYDLCSELRKDPERRQAVNEALKRIDTISDLVLQGKANRRDITKAEAELMPLCGFNFGLLMPKMFPRYPVDEPLEFSSRPFMFAMTAQAPSSVVTMKTGRQVGKCADGDTVLQMSDGSTCSMRDLFEEGIAA